MYTTFVREQGAMKSYTLGTTLLHVILSKFKIVPDLICVLLFVVRSIKTTNHHCIHDANNRDATHHFTTHQVVRVYPSARHRLHTRLYNDLRYFVTGFKNSTLKLL